MSVSAQWSRMKSQLKVKKSKYLLYCCFLESAKFILIDYMQGAQKSRQLQKIKTVGTDKPET